MVESVTARVHTPLALERRRMPEELRVAQKPVDAIIALGMGPVRPQLRGPEGHREPVADFERMRMIAIAAKELAADGFLKSAGVIIPTGRATAPTEEELKPMPMENRYKRARITRAWKIPVGLGEGQMSPREFLEKYPEFRNGQELNRILGKPRSQKENAAIRETTEAELMTRLIQRSVPKSHTREITQKILPEEQAGNTIENVVRDLNEADRRTGGVWRGRIGILTSNFGHISRVGEIFEAMGIPRENLVPLSAEQVLRHAGYGGGYLSRYEAKNIDVATIQNQERWRRGVREMPTYVLPEMALIENDDRLKAVMRGLTQWYGRKKLNDINPKLTDTKTTPDELRHILSSIPREKPPESWGKTADISRWKMEIAQYNKLTEWWLTKTKPAK